jgi:hypothetical protein
VFPLECSICWLTIAGRLLEMRRQRILHEIRHIEWSLCIVFVCGGRVSQEMKATLYKAGELQISDLNRRTDVRDSWREPRSRYDRS